MQTGENVLVLNSVSKHFGGVKAVQNVSLAVKAGERRLFIGTNGAGKTTLFNLIAGDLPVTGGSIVMFGKDVTRTPVRHRVKMGVRRTYQTSALFDGLTVRENLYLALLGEKKAPAHFSLYKSVKGDREAAARLEETAHRVGLGSRLEDNVAGLSHGERRQLELGLAIVGNPKLLMFDEPCSGLSADERQTMLALIRSLDTSITLIFIEHDMDIAFAVADYITVLYDGRLLVEGTPEEISANRQVQQIYLGGSADATTDSAG